MPFMRDVFTIPTNSRQKPALIGSVCEECEEYFFPKTGQKATCDNPFCPRSTSTTHLSGKGKILSATVMPSPVAGDGERASAVILLEEGIKVNSVIIGWEGFQYMLEPGSPVELVLQEMGLNDDEELVIGYAFRLVTGRKKPQFPAEESGEAETPAVKKSAKKKPAKKAAVKKSVKKKPAKKAAVKKSAKKKPAKRVSVKKAAVKKKTAKKSAKKKTAKKKTVKQKSKKSTGKKAARGGKPKRR
ncbi:MAG TPA: hypothetical protein QF533_12640 [Nitrospinota bacterium]|nr:hypothetical protein [Nitrospinota bacterium]MDP7664306.1 hypothetical protein [Nitrospinota bacterium]HJP15176.1 hypothetical protein [Nitrospinota bacterium]